MIRSYYFVIALPIFEAMWNELNINIMFMLSRILNIGLILIIARSGIQILT